MHDPHPDVRNLHPGVYDSHQFKTSVVWTWEETLGSNFPLPLKYIHAAGKEGVSYCLYFSISLIEKKIKGIIASQQKWIEGL